MDTRFGPTLDPDQFESPFDRIVGDLIQDGRSLYESLRSAMRARWKQRSLEILIVDNVTLNAYATENAGGDCIYVFRGALERIHGTTCGLLSAPAFLPGIGNVGVDVPPKGLPPGGFPGIPLLRDASKADQSTPLFWPNDQTRMTFAQMLADIALDFLVCHEIGHVVGGHLDIARTNHGETEIAEFERGVSNSDELTLRHVLECDADAFASHVTSFLHTHPKNAQLTLDTFNPSGWAPRDFALLKYLTAVGVLFRVLYPRAPIRISRCKSSHPHPAVRAFLVASSTMARQLADGSVEANALERIVRHSVRNIEDVWADLCLPGQNPEAPAIWAQNVQDGARELGELYGNARSLLDQHARLRRRWHDWAFDTTDDSP